MNVATPVDAFNVPLVNLAKLESSKYNAKSKSVSLPFSSVYVNMLAANEILVTVSATLETFAVFKAIAVS